MPTSRIGGDYNAEALEAFRSAYAAQMQTPEDQDIHKESGLPTSEVSNTSPWFASTGLWRYPSGRGPDDDLKQPFNPNSFLPQNEDDEEEEDDDILTDEQIDAYLDSLSAEELNSLAQQLAEEEAEHLVLELDSEEDEDDEG
jgi:hypothetical protein